MKQIKAKNEVKKAKTKGKQEGEEVMKSDTETRRGFHVASGI